MGHFRYSLLVAAAIAAGSAIGAEAADFRFPPVSEPMVPIPAAIPIPDYSAWYLRGDIAWSFQENPDLKQSGISFSGEDMEDTWNFGVGFGHYFTDNIRGDVTVDYRLFAEVTGVDAATGSKHTAKLSSTVVLANIYYDLRGRDDFTPYLGAGFGFTFNETNGQRIKLGGAVTGSAGGDTNLALAAAAMAGFSYRMNDGWLFDAGYRFLYLGDAETVRNGTVGALKIDDLFAHELRVGFRYELN